MNSCNQGETGHALPHRHRVTICSTFEIVSVHTVMLNVKQPLSSHSLAHFLDDPSSSITQHKTSNKHCILRRHTEYSVPAFHSSVREYPDDPHQSFVLRFTSPIVPP